MKLVTDGKFLFGIRKGIWPFYKYFDFESPGFWWRRHQIFYLKCWTTEEKARAWYNLLHPKEVK